MKQEKNVGQAFCIFSSSFPSPPPPVSSIHRNTYVLVGGGGGVVENLCLPRLPPQSQRSRRTTFCWSPWQQNTWVSMLLFPQLRSDGGHTDENNKHSCNFYSQSLKLQVYLLGELVYVFPRHSLLQQVRAGAKYESGRSQGDARLSPWNLVFGRACCSAASHDKATLKK